MSELSDVYTRSLGRLMGEIGALHTDLNYDPSATERRVRAFLERAGEVEREVLAAEAAVGVRRTKLLEEAS